MAEINQVQKDSADSNSSGVRALFPLTGEQNINNQLPPEIFDRVLRLLDDNFLWQTRLVSTKWNDIALNILMSKTSGTVEFDYKSGDPDGLHNMGLERIQKLRSILRFTKYPKMFFNELILDACRYSIEIIQLINLLPEFGSNLKSLKLKYITLSVSAVRLMLETWCTNLEELQIGIEVTEDKDSFANSPTPLKLKLRKLSVFGCRAQNLMVSIFKSCPKLQVLHVDIISEPGEFWGKIQNLPETKNIEELKIAKWRGDMTELALLISFNKLTSLTLIIRMTTFSLEHLVGLLKNVGESLEKLIINLFNLNDELDCKIEFPLMNRLKILQLSSNGDGELFIDSIDCLESLPNLEILRLSHLMDNGAKFMDALFLDALYFSIETHTKLNTLFVKQFIQNPETIFAINRVFPNLRDFNLAISTAVIQNSTESWFVELFTGLAEMKNLKILDLTIYDKDLWDRIDFEAGLSPLMASESLQEFKISIHVFIDCYFIIYPRDFPPSLEKALVKIPNLKVLTLRNFRLDKYQSMRLFKTFGQKGILLKADENIVHCATFRQSLLP